MVIIPTHEGGCKSMIIKPYKGNDSYLFISYAHKDRVTAMSIIERMINAGYRVWYDEGIDPGTEWDGNIASHLRSCDGIIALLSRNYLASDNCKDGRYGDAARPQSGDTPEQVPRAGQLL